MRTERILVAVGVERAVDTWMAEQYEQPSATVEQSPAGDSPLVKSGGSKDVHTVVDAWSPIAGLGLDRPNVAGQSRGGNIVRRARRASP